MFTAALRSQSSAVAVSTDSNTNSAALLTRTCDASATARGMADAPRTARQRIHRPVGSTSRPGWCDARQHREPAFDQSPSHVNVVAELCHGRRRDLRAVRLGRDVRRHPQRNVRDGRRARDGTDERERLVAAGAGQQHDACALLHKAHGNGLPKAAARTRDDRDLRDGAAAMRLRAARTRPRRAGAGGVEAVCAARGPARAPCPLAAARETCARQQPWLSCVSLPGLVSG